MLDVEMINVVMLILGGVTSFSAGLIVGTWRVSTLVHRVDDHERRLTGMEKCVSVTFTRLHDRIDDLMLLVGADPQMFRKERRGGDDSDFRGHRDA